MTQIDHTPQPLDHNEPRPDDQIRMQLAQRVREAVPEPTFAEDADQMKQNISDFWSSLHGRLTAKREQRDEIEDEIRELVEATQTWEPVYRRIVEGHRVQRTRRATEETLPLSDAEERPDELDG